MTQKRLESNSDGQFSNSTSKQRNSWLDVLRGLAIFGVVAVHSVDHSDAFIEQSVQSGAFYSLISFGKYGVELFFFLSGWLLASIYGLSGNKLGKPYWVRRIARIYPLWVIFLVINIIRSLLTETGGVHSALNTQGSNLNAIHSFTGIIFLTLSFALFISGSLWNTVIPGGWSIQAEVAHYLLFPIMRDRPIASILRILTLVNLLTGFMAVARPKLSNSPEFIVQLIDAWLRLSLYSSIGYFVIGAFAFLLYRQVTENQSKKTQLNLEIPWLSAAIFLVSTLCIPCPMGSQIEAIGYLAIMILISFCILNINVLKTIFQHLGKYSYFIYFMHFLILDTITFFLKKMNFVGSVIGSQQIIFLVIFSTALGASILTAIPSMKYLERPILKIAHRVK